MLKFSLDWFDGALNAIVEERRTLCSLQIHVDGKNLCDFVDYEDNTKFDSLTVPAIHLAEGISSNWWQIFGSRDKEHSILRYRRGLALPDLRFRSDGSVFEVFSKAHVSLNPHLRFGVESSTTLERGEAERALAKFVYTVIDRLDSKEVKGSEVAACWGRVTESRRDPGERAFCDAAGALGADPYSISQADDGFIDAASMFFSDESLIEFLAGAKGEDRSIFSPGWLGTIEGRPPEVSVLPDIAGIHRSISEDTWRDLYDRPWARGYRAARACRKLLGDGEGERYRSVHAIAKALGSSRFSTTEIEGGIRALISREDGRVHVHLHENGSDQANNFALGRAVGDAVVFRDGGRAVVNNLHYAERQAVGRAFAAEFLAPVNEVMSMTDDGRDLYEVADEFDLSPQVIRDQLHNQQRIEDACTAN